jgi:hypothetical protein
MKLGRKPRKYGLIPHASPRIAKAPSLVIPQSFDWAAGASGFSMFGNDKYGCCGFAGYYDFLFQTSWAAWQRATVEPTENVLASYSQVTGFNPDDPSTDHGSDLQTNLAWFKNTGAVTGMQGETRHKIAGYLEVDCRNPSDMARLLYECGGLYIGMNIPQYIMPPDGSPPAVWDVNPSADNTIIGGHCVGLTGKDPGGFWFLSWATKFYMTLAFVAQFMDEAYAIFDREFLTLSGHTPIGMTIAELEQVQA